MSEERDLSVCVYIISQRPSFYTQLECLCCDAAVVQDLLKLSACLDCGFPENRFRGSSFELLERLVEAFHLLED